MMLRVRRSWRIDEHPQMKVSEGCCYITSHHARNFAIAFDMVYRLWPWRRYLDKDVILENFLGFPVYHMIGAEDV